MLMNLALGAFLPPVCGGYSALKPEMMDSSVLASAMHMHITELAGQEYFLPQHNLCRSCFEVQGSRWTEN
jgi:hypothetical protein